MIKRSALETAIKWLERADRSEQEVNLHLVKKGYSESEITEAIEKVSAYGYLNDRALADRVAKNLRDSLNGELKVNEKLTRRGLPAPGSQDDSTQRALALLNQRFLTQKQTQEQKVVAKAARLLSSRGFQEETIEEALGHFFPVYEG